jgi:hypothetical protein
MASLNPPVLVSAASAVLRAALRMARSSVSTAAGLVRSIYTWGWVLVLGGLSSGRRERTYRELLVHSRESISRRAIRHLELGVVLDAEHTPFGLDVAWMMMMVVVVGIGKGRDDEGEDEGSLEKHDGYMVLKN